MLHPLPGVYLTATPMTPVIVSRCSLLYLTNIERVIKN